MNVSDIRPTKGLLESTQYLDDRAFLERRYNEEGYLFFRSMVPSEAAEAARLKMARALVAEGMISDTSADARWIGGDVPNPPEESPLFAGICRALFEWPGVSRQFERLLGEPVSMVPNVLYRAYKPNNLPGPVHQDGAFNPGVEGYRSLWIALGDVDEETGGMVLAPGYHRQGSLHERSTMVVPAGTIDEHAWRREDYRQGDVVVLHGFTPHLGMPNRSQRVRYSVDARIQSAANPTVLEGELAEVAREMVTLRFDDGRLCQLKLGEQTILRFGRNGTPVTYAEFADQILPGRRIMATREGDVALMLRHVSPE
jgi:hypothetical protein